jgi:hypothetical protein
MRKSRITVSVALCALVTCMALWAVIPSLPAAAAQAVPTPNAVVTNSAAGGVTSLGASVTFTIKVSGPARSTTPTGIVTWSVSGTAGVTSCKASTTTLSSGTATCSLTASNSGTYVVSGTYGGSRYYAKVTSAPSTVTVAGSVPTSIPVFAWHELNNGCASTAPICNAADPESVSTAQLTAELGYLASHGYHTVTPSQYEAWTEGSHALLPPNPVLLVADNGIESLLSGVQPILKADGFTMTVAVISGFADGASGVCPEPTYEPGCPVANDNGWDATWSQLAGLSPSLFNFIIEAGTAGHFVQTYDPSCTAFYACKVTGETDASYEARVASDLSTGQAKIIAQLGSSRFTSGLWVVPYSDDGYPACSDPGCVAQSYDGPPGWLTSWTAKTFPVAFVQDAFRNGVQNERFRIDVQGWMSETQFESMLTSDTSLGDFTLTHTSGPRPTEAVTDSTAASPAALGGSVTFTATVAGPAGTATPTGTLTWSVTGPGTPATCTATATALDATGTATCTLPTPAAGTYTVTASYGGDGNYAATLVADTVKVPLATPTVVVSDSTATTPATLGGSVTFTATVTGSPGAASPSGTVTWSVGGTGLATACAASTTGLNGSGTATCSVPTPTGGTYVVSSSYGGDGNYLPAGSAPDIVTVASAKSTNPVASIPVVSWDSTTMTQTQVGAELAYLAAAGYHTINAADYVSWAQSQTVALPANPILITVTGGNAAFLSAVTPTLVSAGYSAVDFVSTQQADSGGSSATWVQLAALNPAAWQFSFASGASGGTLVASDPSTCNIYYACKAPGETDAAYEARVANEIGIGRLKLDNGLWMQTVNDFLWSPPFGDAGQSGATYNGPAGWLPLWASDVFPVVFVSGKASGNNEHTVLDVTGTLSESSFESTLVADLADSLFNR